MLFRLFGDIIRMGRTESLLQLVLTDSTTQRVVVVRPTRPDGQARGLKSPS